MSQSSENKSGWLVSLLEYRHTGKLVGLINTVLYSILSYYIISYLKSLISSKDATEQSVGIMLLLFSVGVISWLRDLITDVADMQCPANKERDAHRKTKEALSQLQKEKEAAEKETEQIRRMLHALKSNITNTIMNKENDSEALKKITTVMSKANVDNGMNNIATPPSGEVEMDYMTLFG
jgi:cell shape-determining protein MreC